jgi:putative membrane protein
MSFVIAGILACSYSVAYSQNATSSAADKKFVHTALQGGIAEVEMGKLAVEKGNGEDIKQFGQRMVKDHTELGNEMKLVAQQIGVTPPDGVSVTQKATEMKLKALSGDAFDKAYITAMVKDHKEDLEEFKAEAANGQNEAVKDAAGKGSKMIEEHLQMIERIAQAHNIDTSSS